MICPRCMRSRFTSPSGSSHYICIRDPDLDWEETGCGAQFRFVIDDRIRFPHSAIFMNRGREEFFRKPYLILSPLNQSI